MCSFFISPVKDLGRSSTTLGPSFHLAELSEDAPEAGVLPASMAAVAIMRFFTQFQN